MWYKPNFRIFLISYSNIVSTWICWKVVITFSPHCLHLAWPWCVKVIQLYLTSAQLWFPPGTSCKYYYSPAGVISSLSLSLFFLPSSLCLSVSLLSLFFVSLTLFLSLSPELSLWQILFLSQFKILSVSVLSNYIIAAEIQKRVSLMWQFSSFFPLLFLFSFLFLLHSPGFMEGFSSF